MTQTNWREAKIIENKHWIKKANRVHTTTVEGHTYEFWSDAYFGCTFAQNEQGDIRTIYGCGYIHKDLTVRKAIAATFGHNTFRK